MNIHFIRFFLLFDSLRQKHLMTLWWKPKKIITAPSWDFSCFKSSLKVKSKIDNYIFGARFVNWELPTTSYFLIYSVVSEQFSRTSQETGTCMTSSFLLLTYFKNKSCWIPGRYIILHFTFSCKVCSLANFCVQLITTIGKCTCVFKKHFWVIKQNS